MRIFILDGNENQTVAATRSLARAGHSVEVGAPTSWSKAGLSRFATGRFTYTSPEENASAFVEAIADRVKPGTLVLPMTERTTLPLSGNREAIHSAGGLMVLPKHETLLRAFDKGQMTALAQSLGIPIPRSECLATHEAAADAAVRFTYPAVLKPRTSQEAEGGTVHATGAPVYVQNADDFLRAYDDLRSRCREVIAQEWIPGQGTGYFALMRNGALRAQFAHRRLRDVRPTGSGSAYRESIHPPVRLRLSALALLEALQWHGVAMVEFRAPADGAPVFLEINGRFWNSLALPIHAGVDFPAMLAEMAETGEVSHPLPSYEPGVRCRWLLGDVRHLLEVFRGAPAGFPGQFPSRTKALASFVATSPLTATDNFQITDPLPEAGDWLDFALHKIPGQLKKTPKPVSAESPKRAVLKGAMHLHSTYSDGDYSLGEIREIFEKKGCSFALVTDHSEWFEDEAKREAYVRECAELSDENFLLLPSLEYACDDRLHILGYGLTGKMDTTKPEEVIARIRERGGVCVIAHPQNRFFGRIENIDPLPHGIEVWNSKYDGQYAPRPVTFSLLRRMQKRDTSIMAFCGQDLHWKKQFRGLFCEIHTGELSREAILAALAEGHFNGLYTSDSGEFELPSTGVLPEKTEVRLTTNLRKARVIRRATTRTKVFGKMMPGVVKAQLRRIF